jgi:hypothetical protein
MQMGNFRMSIRSFMLQMTEGGSLQVLHRQRLNPLAVQRVLEETKGLINLCKILMVQERGQSITNMAMERAREMVLRSR